jgi:hypothetical protein
MHLRASFIPRERRQAELVDRSDVFLCAWGLVYEAGVCLWTFL